MLLLGLVTFPGELAINVPAVLAAVVLATLPVLALYIVAALPGQRLTAGSSK